MLPKFREFQHVFWREFSHDKIVGYELNTITYGINWAPFLALRILLFIADNDCTLYRQVRDALLLQIYVDNICYKAHNVASVAAGQADLTSVLDVPDLNSENGQEIHQLCWRPFLLTIEL